MENNSGRSLIGVFVPITVILIGIVGLYYLYQYLFGPRTLNRSIILGRTQKADIDVSKPVTIPSSNLPGIYEGGQFTISTWIYINNWTYRSGFNKHILSIGGPNFDTIRVYLGCYKPSLQIRLQTGTTTNTTSGDSLLKSQQNSVFGDLQTDNGLLSGSPVCDIPDIELQKWVHIGIAVNGRTVDVYTDGRLARSCVLPDLYKVDAGGYNATMLAYGGFGGSISTSSIYDSALNPEDMYSIYMAGPEPITNILDWLRSFFAPKETL